MVCSTPEVAVCVVGQLRTGERAGLQRQMRSAWDRVGASCVDVFVSLGIEAVEETANHGASAAKAYENASSMVARLRPLESHVSSAPMPTSAAPGLDCRRDATPPTRLCHKGPSLVRPEARLLPCWDDSCTHCAATAYYAHASRLAACARTVRSAAARLGRRYRYFVHHRPDLWLYGMPRYEEWPFGNALRAIAVGARADGLSGRRAAAAPRATFAAGIGHSAASSPQHGRSRGDRGQSAPDGRTSSAVSALALAPASPAAFYCAPLPASPPSDYLGIVPFEHLHVVASIDEFMFGCHAREESSNVSKWCTGESRWPSWHHPECLLHAAYARGGVRVRSLTDEHWPQMRRACRIIREAGDQHRHRPTQLNSILNSTQLNTSTGR